ncbi:magnesium/cobalt transporter CorA [Nocardioides euryhalodurans]|uniref:Magnesium transport protein CorA n=1 Tax=Nocardioides euryhalodurans TaxID=2518370 RepID=A0A4P7GGY5_9ACTN|nr:magnesium/cobalt transporter CorA [Nocardioides euryhalodurans]QBR91138.1 magnesium/cobalt transporter CorA [Nocardioides euryhalodurans]
MIVDSALYRRGTRVPVECDVADLATMRERCEPGDFVWVGLHEPDLGELAKVANAFQLHPLAVEDAVNAHQRPKLERYDDTIFLTVKTLWYVDAEDAVETGEINLFIGADFVVSVRHGEGGGLKRARVDLEAREAVLAHGPTAVVYAVCDQVVDAYEEVVDELVADVDEVEMSVFSEERTNDSARIYVLKRELAEVRRAVMPLREPVGRFANGMVRGIDPEAGAYFRDVGDHLARAAATIDELDGLLSTAFDAHMARISVQQNEDMRKISAGAALIVVPTLIAGIYGMNFDVMPELHWDFGYAWALLLMFGASAGLLWFFKRSGWL